MNDIEDYLEKLENLRTLQKGEGLLTITCAVQFCGLIEKYLAEDARDILMQVKDFLKNGSPSLEEIRLQTKEWKKYFNDHSNKDTNGYKAVLCTLSIPKENHEHYETLIHTLDYCRYLRPELKDEDFKMIVESVYS